MLLHNLLSNSSAPGENKENNEKGNNELFILVLVEVVIINGFIYLTCLGYKTPPMDMDQKTRSHWFYPIFFQGSFFFIMRAFRKSEGIKVRKVRTRIKKKKKKKNPCQERSFAGAFASFSYPFALN